MREPPLANGISSVRSLVGGKKSRFSLAHTTAVPNGGYPCPLHHARVPLVVALSPSIALVKPPQRKDAQGIRQATSLHCDNSYFIDPCGIGCHPETNVILGRLHSEILLAINPIPLTVQNTIHTYTISSFDTMPASEGWVPTDGVEKLFSSG